MGWLDSRRSGCVRRDSANSSHATTTPPGLSLSLPQFLPFRYLPPQFRERRRGNPHPPRERQHSRRVGGYAPLHVPHRPQEGGATGCRMTRGFFTRGNWGKFHRRPAILRKPVDQLLRDKLRGVPLLGPRTARLPHVDHGAPAQFKL